MAAKSGKNIVEECDAGLIKAVVPLFKDDKLIGAFGGCGKMLDDGEIEVEYICRTIKSEEPEIAELSQSIEIMSEAAAEEAVEYMANEVAIILK